MFLLAGIILLWGCNTTVTTEQQTTSQNESVTADVSDKQAVESVVLTLFDGVRESDKEKISSSLAQDAEFVSAREENGTLVEKITKGSDFAEKAGAPHEEVWDERLTDIEVELQGQDARLTANYEFYLGQDYSHRGEMKVDLKQHEEAWLIQRVWYTVVKK